MKKVISISLGSPERDHSSVMKLGNQSIEVSREGVDGKVNDLIARVKELDGTVDCFGAGGYLIDFKVGDQKYKLRQAYKIKKAIIHTPIVDGGGVKDTIERNCMQNIKEEISEFISDKPKIALITSAIDRYGMASSLVDEGYDLLAGDLRFGLGVPKTLYSLKTVRRMARVLMPIVSKVPIQWLYPTGEKQSTNTPKHVKLFEKATIIAGDFIYTKKYSPKNLDGKVILTNTTTASDIDMLKEKGVSCVITTTPRIDGRTYGTNVFESAITAYSEKGRPLSIDEIQQIVDELGIKPQVLKL
ncbi:MAG: quinate 5-dehydrogenase [Candidatus Heimdallarchaeota archaeon]|nr:quinate 5-dehydrogenase [Candidatus Heimdallarchaeota archaeon]